MRGDIQGMRALAVLAVLGYHAGVPGFGGGYLGVDVFFVISGYLIGGQLVRALRTTGRVDLWTFYARRARRILPASLVVIALTVLASLLLAAPVRRADIAIDGVWAALSAANLRFAITGTDYLAGTTPSPLQHYWSLGVEEQFYLVVPLLLIGIFAVARRRPRLLVGAGIVVVAISFAVCLLWGTGSPWTYFSLLPRAWELGVGVLAAVLVQTRDVAPAAARILAWAGVAGLVVAGAAGSADGFPHPGVGTVLPVVAAAALLIAGERTVVARALSVRPAQAVGAISYSLYLVHWPLLALAREVAPGDGSLPVGITLALVVVAFPLAWLLRRFVEQPFLHRRPVRPRRSVLTGVAAIAVLASLLGISAPALAGIPLTSDRTSTDAAAPLPAGTPFVPANVHPSLEGAVADTGALYTDGCQQGTGAAALIVCRFGPDGAPQLVLFGDSHAGRWFPALQSAFTGRQVQIVTLTKSGCRSLETEKLWAGAENRSCAAWRAAAVAWIAENRPQVVVLADHIGLSSRSTEQVERQWSAATVSTAARFPAGTRVAILAETPEFVFSPPVCLSRHLGDADACAEPRAQAVNTGAIEGVRTGAEEAGAAFVDLTDWFCGTDSCPVVIGRTLVYSDEHHLTATYSAQLGAPLRQALEPLLAPLPGR